MPTPRQLPLPTGAPKFDDTGLHSSDCPCSWCESGHRPTNAQRWAAKAAHERALAARRLLTEIDEKKAVKAAVVSARLAREAAETAARVKAERELRARCRPLTDDEIDEMRRENGLRPKRRGSK